MAHEALTVALDPSVLMLSQPSHPASAGSPKGNLPRAGPVRQTHPVVLRSAFAFMGNPGGCGAIEPVGTTFRQLRGTWAVLGWLTAGLVNKERGVSRAERRGEEKQQSCAEGHSE